MLSLSGTNARIQLASLDISGSICDGPGIRTVVYLQGCNRHCLGCHNPETWNLKGGRSIRIAELVQSIVDGSRTQRVTISGGEPLVQKEALTILVKLLKQNHFEIALYTSYTEADVPTNILAHIDFLKTGEYRQELRTVATTYVGSANQCFRKLKNYTGAA